MFFACYWMFARSSGYVRLPGGLNLPVSSNLGEVTLSYFKGSYYEHWEVRTLLYLLVSQYWFVLDMQVLMLGRRGLGSTSSTWVALAQPFINPVVLFYWANRNWPILVYFDTCIFQTCRISALLVGFLRKERHNFYIQKKIQVISCLMTGVCLFHSSKWYCSIAAAPPRFRLDSRNTTPPSSLCRVSKGVAVEWRVWAIEEMGVFMFELNPSYLCQMHLYIII